MDWAFKVEGLTNVIRFVITVVDGGKKGFLFFDIDDDDDDDECMVKIFFVPLSLILLWLCRILLSTRGRRSLVAVEVHLLFIFCFKYVNIVEGIFHFHVIGLQFRRLIMGLKNH